MKREVIHLLGMKLERWTHKSCTAEFGVGEDDEGKWATLYSIKSVNEGKGHATALLRATKAHYKSQGRRVGGTVALNERMRRIYCRLGIHEYK